MVRLRFAPSPTGPFHIGGARTALFNYLFARNQGGKFILRIDDTDRSRSEKRFEEDIIAGLKWLGLNFDEGPEVGGPAGSYHQAERKALYAKQLEVLLARGAAEKCPDGAIRQRYGHDLIRITDLVCGQCEFRPQSLGPPPVLIRSDGEPTYHLASVCDDIDMKITHVVRGQDHLTNTAKHVLMFRALGVNDPQFAHLPLILGSDGHKLSKRDTATLTAVTEFRNAGFIPEAIINFLMLLGWSDPRGREILTLAEAGEVFSFDRVHKGGAVFDEPRLRFLNVEWMKLLSGRQVLDYSASFIQGWNDRLGALFEPGRFEMLVHALKDGFHSLKEVEDVAKLVSVDMLDLTPAANDFIASDRDFPKFKLCLKNYLEGHRPKSNFYSEADLSALIDYLKRESGRAGKGLFQALRVALTGDVSGHELKVIFPYLHYGVLLKRVGS
ncbi:glutamate--tRNA ligase [bacterium]|nr:glutamate--tRNA ligase [bacterium]